MPPGVFGLFFYGPTQVQVAFGNGFRCVGGSTQRVQPAAQASGAGVTTRQLDLSAFPHAGTITPGAVLNFQLWYRDPSAGGAQFNVTDGTQVQFQ